MRNGDNRFAEQSLYSESRGDRGNKLRVVYSAGHDGNTKQNVRDEIYDRENDSGSVCVLIQSKSESAMMQKQKNGQQLRQIEEKGFMEHLKS